MDDNRAPQPVPRCHLGFWSISVMVSRRRPPPSPRPRAAQAVARRRADPLRPAGTGEVMCTMKCSMSNKVRAMSKLSNGDMELIAAASEAIRSRYRNDWQEVRRAMRTRDGRIITGVNIDAYLGRMAVCAEAIAISRSITEAGDKGIETDRGRAPSEAARGGPEYQGGVALRLAAANSFTITIPKARVIVPNWTGAIHRVRSVN